MPRNHEEQDDYKYQIFSPGWAKCPSHGHCYGRKYINDFKDDVLDMFRSGEQDKSQKMEINFLKIVNFFNNLVTILLICY
jgi:hypothetical protein